VLDGVKETLANFVIPGDLDDIATMPVGSMATVEGTGDLKFWDSVNLLTLTNPLASATLPVVLPRVDLVRGYVAMERDSRRSPATPKSDFQRY
jgi:hypothetical protein